MYYVLGTIFFSFFCASLLHARRSGGPITTCDCRIAHTYLDINLRVIITSKPKGIVLPYARLSRGGGALWRRASDVPASPRQWNACLRARFNSRSSRSFAVRDRPPGLWRLQPNPAADGTAGSSTIQYRSDTLSGHANPAAPLETSKHRRRSGGDGVLPLRGRLGCVQGALQVDEALLVS
ncbi:uncharacterized protein K452DRAFT_288982 [Aplosporella prunicola CBS 121167]|uniref:Secreted protein n=1 Tax=Aplosporella prunicola CBS 121167 TaxID=1176127 RepID=A0A6A6BCL0_9PEZI|nr:uncharacterized protein K452DRAFT_288982 [Aplosporella prunicola CBS 121167]KAF2140211.1 hypothetical protein K452DRAFT_288982 [Aplosporella prunicola CBS 121167]